MGPARHAQGPLNFANLNSMLRLAAILSCLALAGCGAVPAQQPPTVELGAEVTLAPGEGVAVNNARLKLRFLGVSEDSRCPRDVNCVWAGEVKIQLEIYAISQSRVELLEGGSTVIGQNRVTLVRVAPEPASTAKIVAQDYRATLKID